MKRFLLLIFIIAQSLKGQTTPQNIMITDVQNPNEPSIIINKANPQNMVVAENSFYYQVSNDGGYTWQNLLIDPSSWGFCCDSSLNSDTQGNIYFFHLSYYDYDSWIDRIVCQRLTNNGNYFTQESYTGLNPPKKQDKQWAVIDQASGNIYVTWTQFDEYGTSNPFKYTNIHFSKSTDGGQTWSQPIQINEVSGNCVDSDDTVEGAVPAIGPNGEIYVSWAGPAGLVFDKSTDGGQTWLIHDILINDINTIGGGWDYDIPGLNRCNGLPVTKCDISNGPYRGTIYVNWSDQRNGTDNTDIFLSKSTDGGNTWSAPVKVNDDNSGKHQFLTWMDIDQSTGYLYFVFYDRRNYNDDHTDVYMAISKDGGETFGNIKISENSFVPDASYFFGDYTNVNAYNGVIRPVWTYLDGSSQSLWTAIVSESDFVSIEKNESPVLEQNLYPVPVTETLALKYKLKKSTQITVNLLDESGRLIKTLIKNQSRNRGKNREVFELKSLNMQKGIYYIQLITGANSAILKMIKI